MISRDEFDSLVCDYVFNRIMLTVRQRTGITVAELPATFDELEAAARADELRAKLSAVPGEVGQFDPDEFMRSLEEVANRQTINLLARMVNRFKGQEE